MAPEDFSLHRYACIIYLQRQLSLTCLHNTPTLKGFIPRLWTGGLVMQLLTFLRIGSLAEYAQLLGLVLQKTPLPWLKVWGGISITNLVTGIWLFM